MSHIGIELAIGINIHKPFYKVDWQLNQGYIFVNENGQKTTILGDLNWYYEVKRTVATRMGLKYYLISNTKKPKHNFYVGAHINANLGQADFSELSLGYVYRFKLK